MPEPYDPNTAIKKIRFILSNGRLIITRHCRNDSMPLRNVDDLDIIKVLEKNGVINRKPEFDRQHQRWKYRVDGRDLEGDPLAVVVNIIEDDCVVVTITVF